MPFSRLRSLQEFLDRQDERVVQVPLDGSSGLLPPDRAARLRRGARLDGTLETDGTRYLYAARLVNGKGFILLRPASSTTSAWRPHIEGLVVAAVATAALAALIAFLLARAIARPVRRVAEATRGLAGSTPTPPLVPVEGPRELALLAESFNEVAVALAKAREAEQAFLLSVSHELKTPLTAIRGYAEGLGEGALPADEAAADDRRPSRSGSSASSATCSTWRGCARPSSASAASRSTWRAIAAGGAAALRGARRASSASRSRPRAPRRRRRLGDADRTLQIVSNLVENALRLTPAGGSVRIVTAPGSIRVEDTGPGLRPEELEQAFERFYLYSRYGRERPVGTGLGLAIVKELAEGMGGSVAAESTPGELTVFTVRLPHVVRDAAPRAARSRLIRVLRGFTFGERAA